MRNRLLRHAVGLLVAICAASAAPAHAQWHQIVQGDGLRMQDQSSTSPFSTGQFGLWRSGNTLKLQLSSGTVLSFFTPQIINATFSASDTASISWSNLGGTQFVGVGVPVVTDGLGGVALWLSNKTSTGATLNASAPWTGSVMVFVITQ